MKIIVIFIIGFVVGTIGLDGAMRAVNNGLTKVQQVTKEAAQ
jgi:hypothetical protein